MTDETETTDEDEGCPGHPACDDPYCDQRQEYEVEFTVTVKGRVMAHTDEEADELAAEVSSDVGAELPHRFGDEWTDDPAYHDTDYWVTNTRTAAIENAALLAKMAEMAQEQEATS